jgi:tetratricopeptide (TPR) repeat protein
MNQKLSTLAALLGMFIVVGCASEKKQAEAYRSQQGQGVSAMGEGNGEFEKAKSPPIAAETHFAAGQLAESQGNFELAIQRYEQALKQDARHPRALYRSAICYTQLKLYPAAIGRWNRYVQATQEAAGYNNLALTYELTGKPREAELTYKKGIAAHPKDAACNINYGLLLARTGRATDAEAQLCKVLKPAQAAYNLGAVYQEQGNKAQAKEKYEQALQLDPEMTDAQSRLASLE